MKRLLATLMVLCLLAAAPMGLAESMQKLVLSPQIDLSGNIIPADELPIAQGVFSYISSLRIEVLADEKEDMLQLQVGLYAGDYDLGTIDVVVTEEAVFIAGDMLPEGWMVIDMDMIQEMLAASGAELAGQMQALSFQSMGMMEAWMVWMQAILIASENWVMEHPQIAEEMDVAQLPEGAVADAWVRVYLLPEMYSEIFAEADQLLREVAAAGELRDIDGSEIPAAGYDESLLGQMMGELTKAYDQVSLSGVVDVLMDSQEDLTGLAVDVLAAEEAAFFMKLLRNVAEDDTVVWDGEYLVAEIDEDGEEQGLMEGILAATKSAPGQQPQRLDAGVAGVLTDGDDDVMAFEASLYAEYDEEDALELGMNMQFEQGDTAADIRFGMASTPIVDGSSVEVAMQAQVLDGSEEMQMLFGLALTHQSLAESLPDPDLSGTLYPIEDEASLDAYLETASGSLTGWILKVMSTLPTELLNTIGGL